MVWRLKRDASAARDASMGRPRLGSVLTEANPGAPDVLHRDSPTLLWRRPPLAVLPRHPPADPRDAVRLPPRPSRPMRVRSAGGALGGAAGVLDAVRLHCRLR